MAPSRAASVFVVAMLLSACAATVTSTDGGSVSPDTAASDSALRPDVTDASRGCRVYTDCGPGEQCIFHTPGCDATGTCERTCTSTPPGRVFCSCSGFTRDTSCMTGPAAPFVAWGACEALDSGSADVTDAATADVQTCPPGYPGPSCAPGEVAVACSRGPMSWCYCRPGCTTDSDCPNPHIGICAGGGIGETCNGVLYCAGSRFECSCGMCASPDTPILTPEGEQPIASLRVGDLVVSRDHGHLVAVVLLAVHRQPVMHHRVVHVVLANGRDLRITAGHPTADGRTFGELQPGDDLGGVRVVRVARVPYEHEATWDILPASDTGTYVAAGALIGSTLTCAACATLSDGR